MHFSIAVGFYQCRKYITAEKSLRFTILSPPTIIISFFRRKRPIRNLQQMASEGLNRYFVKIWEAAMDICAAYPAYHNAFVIIANGGKRQEVQQVHFHLFANHELVHPYAAQEQAENLFYRDQDICILQHPDPNWETHFVIMPALFQMAADKGNPSSYLSGILHSIDILDASFHIVQRGYSLVYQYTKQETETGFPIFHIVSGEKRK